MTDIANILEQLVWSLTILDHHKDFLDVSSGLISTFPTTTARTRLSGRPVSYSLSDAVCSTIYE